MTSCTSCGAPIVWAVHWRTRNRMPLDEKIVTTGLRFRIDQDDAGQTIAFAVDRSSDAPGLESHYATCPNAEHHRRAR